MNKFGTLYREHRLNLGLGLRRYCKQHSLDPSNISKIERGVLDPPQDDLLEKHAGYLGLEKGSEAYKQFVYLASIEKGKIPSDIMDDKKIVEHLPVFFRKLKQNENPQELAENLKNIIKDAWRP